MTTMKKAVETILEKLGQLEPFRQREDFAIKIENAPFMPLSIEKHGKLVTITHYLCQNARPA